MDHGQLKINHVMGYKLMDFHHRYSHPKVIENFIFKKNPFINPLLVTFLMIIYLYIYFCFLSIVKNDQIMAQFLLPLFY